MMGNKNYRFCFRKVRVQIVCVHYRALLCDIYSAHYVTPEIFSVGNILGETNLVVTSEINTRHLIRGDASSTKKRRLFAGVHTKEKANQEKSFT